MIRALTNWVDNRTGLRKFIDLMLLEHIPGGAKWRYVWGSALAFVFGLQLITGLMLMTAYSPSTNSAWGSVYFIQYEMDFGWLIRGLHHYGSQTMVVLLALHMLQVVIAGAHLPPREFNWWLGLGLMGVVLGMSLTGYLLPWDQKGYWATRVATAIAGGVPVVGPHIQRIVVGGPEYGNATVTRFFALHVGILPGILIALLIAHIAIFRRHGVTHPKHAKGEGWFWPDQAFRDLLVCLVIFGVMLFLVFNGHAHHIERAGEEHEVVAAAQDGEKTTEKTSSDLYQHWAKAGRRGLGANLDAPADKSKKYEPRPEWYFFFLFQILKYFEGDLALIGTVVIPTLAGGILFMLPLLGFGWMRPIGHIVGVLVVTVLLTAVATLTCLALADDAANEVQHAMLTRIGLVVAPLVAAVMITFLAITSVLPAGGFRAIVSFLGITVMTVFLVCTGLLLKVALGDPSEIPSAVNDLMTDQIAQYERGTPAAKEHFDDAMSKAQSYIKGVKQNSLDAARAVNIAAQGIRPDGDRTNPLHDPVTQFKPLFMKYCASCHSYGEWAKAGKEKPLFQTTKEPGYEKAKFTASDLFGYGSKERIHSFLLDPTADRFYGRIPDFNSTMANYVRRWKKKHKDDYVKDMEKIAEFLTSAPIGQDAKKHVKAQEHDGFKILVGKELNGTNYADKYGCMYCHSYTGYDADKKEFRNFRDPEPDMIAPDLTAPGSAEKLRLMMIAPDHPLAYGKRNQMPRFRDKESLTWHLEKATYESFLKNSLGSDAKEALKTDYVQMPDVDRELIVRYLTGDHRVVFGGGPISGPKKKQPKNK